MTDVATRAACHAALGDPVRLAIVDELSRSDRAPIELRNLLGIESNLLAHHLDVLENVGLVCRTRSSGDRRRRYVRLRRTELPTLVPGRPFAIGEALFVCTANSARSQLAAAIWGSHPGMSAQSAGTRPAQEVHPGAIAAARRFGLDLTTARPRGLSAIRKLPPIIVTVCDQAHEELKPDVTWLHWSVPDPVEIGTRAAFDAVITDLRSRIIALTQSPTKGSTSP